MIGPGNHRPLAAKHVALLVLHLIMIGEGLHGMLARLHDRRLQGPEATIVGQHQQVGSFPGAVGTEITDLHVKALPPLCAVMYGEFQFHNHHYFSAKIRNNSDYICIIHKYFVILQRFFMLEEK